MLVLQRQNWGQLLDLSNASRLGSARGARREHYNESCVNSFPKQLLKLHTYLLIYVLCPFRFGEIINLPKVRELVH